MMTPLMASLMAPLLEHRSILLAIVAAAGVKLSDGRQYPGDVQGLTRAGVVLTTEQGPRTVPWKHVDPRQVDQLLNRHCKERGPEGFLLSASVYSSLRRYDSGWRCLAGAKELGADPAAMASIEEALAIEEAKPRMVRAVKSLQDDNAASALLDILSVKEDLLPDSFREKAKAIREAGEHMLTADYEAKDLDAAYAGVPIAILGVDTFATEKATLVVGRLQNLSLEAVDGVVVEIEATGGLLLEPVSQRKECGPLEPGQTLPFSLVVPDAGAVDVHISAEPVEKPVDADANGSAPQQSDSVADDVIVEVARALKGDNSVVLFCTVENRGDEPLDGRDLTVAFFNLRGEILVEKQSRIPPPALEPGEKRLVEIEVNVWQDFHAYRVWANEQATTE